MPRLNPCGFVPPRDQAFIAVVAHPSTDATGIGAGVLEMVRPFFPAVHADVAWAICHALDHADFTAFAEDAPATARGFVALF